MAALQTTEAKIYKALDKMEAIVQHNESAIATWEPQEYALNLTYGVEQSQFSPYMQALREALRQETLRKMEQEARHRSRENGIKILLAGRIEGDDSADRRKPNARNVLLSVPTNGA